MAKSEDYYVVNVEDHVVQITSYIVKANDADHAKALLTKGIYAYESECETVDTLSSEIKSVEGLWSNDEH